MTTQKERQEKIPVRLREIALLAVMLTLLAAGMWLVGIKEWSRWLFYLTAIGAVGLSFWGTYYKLK